MIMDSGEPLNRKWKQVPSEWLLCLLGSDQELTDAAGQVTSPRTPQGLHSQGNLREPTQGWPDLL